MRVVCHLGSYRGYLSLYLTTSFQGYTLPLHAALFFFFNDTATTEIYTLSLHDALPIFTVSALSSENIGPPNSATCCPVRMAAAPCFNRSMFLSVRSLAPRLRFCRSSTDRKSTRLNSSHDQISYAVFCLDRKSTRLNSSH